MDGGGNGIWTGIGIGLDGLVVYGGDAVPSWSVCRDIIPCALGQLSVFEFWKVKLCCIHKFPCFVT